MAFPSTPLPIVARLALGANPVDPASWAFTAISDDVRSASGVSITTGRSDETSQVNPTSIGLTLDNTSGNYCRTNPLGAYYGSLSRGTPLEVAVTRINDTFTRTSSPGLGTDSVSGLAWTHSTSSVWAATGSAGTCTLAAANTATYAYQTSVTGADVDMTGTVQISAVATGAAWVHALIVRVVDTSNHYRLHVEFGTGGTLGCKIAKMVGGSLTDLTSVTSTGVTYTSSTVVAYRVRVVGSLLQIRAWNSSSAEPTTWTCQATDTSLPDAGYVGIYSWRVAGNTNAGSLISTFDDYRADIIRSATPVPEWPARWDQSGNDATSPIVGAGILRRLSQGQSALRSPIYRQLSGLTSYTQGYWPLEDGSEATVATSAVSRGSPATLSGVSLGVDDCPAGASSAATLDTGGTSQITGRVQRWTAATTGYAVMAYVRMPTLSGSAAGIPGNRIMSINAAGTVVQWIIYATSGGFNIQGVKADGTLQVDLGSYSYQVVTSQWMAIQLEAEESGGNVNWALLWHQVGSTTFYSASGSYAGTADLATSATLYAPVDGTAVSHLWIGTDDLPFVDSTFQQVSAGYAGEKAGARLARLCTEEDVLVSLIGDSATTAPMGAQRAAALLDLLRECETADQGVLHERGAGLGYLTRVARYNGDPVMALDFTSGHVAAAPEPTDDDQRLRNRVILRRAGGSEVTAEDAASIAVDGVYVDELDVNLQTDSQLSDHAYWRLHLGTLDGLRWPSIQLDLARNPSLISDWCKMRLGSRITIANPPSQVGTDDLDLIVEGWTERLSEFGWDVTITCSPASAWKVGVYDDTGSRYDSSSTTLASSAAAGVTSLSLTTVIRSDCWSTTAEPYDLIISGEVVTVTSMGAVSGTGPYTQTATVTRAVNDIAKTLPAGSPVHLASPARYAL